MQGYLKNLAQLTGPGRNQRVLLLTCLLNSSSFSIHMYSANGSSSEPNWLLRTTSPVPIGAAVVPMVGSFMSLRGGLRGAAVSGEHTEPEPGQNQQQPSFLPLKSTIKHSNGQRAKKLLRNQNGRSPSVCLHLLRH